MQARKYTRYPIDTPVSFAIDHMIGEHQICLKDASQGGLSFKARGCIDIGTHLNMSIPAAHDELLNAMGKVAWCQPLENGQCQVGVKFENLLTLLSIVKVVLRH